MSHFDVVISQEVCGEVSTNHIVVITFYAGINVEFRFVMKPVVVRGRVTCPNIADLTRPPILNR